MTPLPDDYQSRSAAEKQALLWANLLATRYDDAALPNRGMIPYGLRAAFSGLFSVKHLRQSFLHVADEMPHGRKKIVHPFGSTCCIRLDPVPNHPFTGLFRGGALGLMRTGLALPSKSFTPGMAYKFFIDGRPSANTVVIPNLMGQGDDDNLFSVRGSNRLPEFHGVMLSVIKVMFQRAAVSLGSTDLEWNRLPVDMMAAATADGNSEATPCAPFELFFEPTTEAQLARDRQPDYRIKLKAISPGTPLFKLSGRATAESETFPIGTITTTSEFIASRYGDEKLFFQHDPGILATTK